MSDETSKVQVSVNLPESLWERLQADVRGAGQVIIDALEAHLPAAAGESVGSTATVQLDNPPAETTTGAAIADQAPVSAPEPQVDPAPAESGQ